MQLLELHTVLSVATRNIPGIEIPPPQPIVTPSIIAICITSIKLKSCHCLHLIYKISLLRRSKLASQKLFKSLMVIRTTPISYRHIASIPGKVKRVSHLVSNMFLGGIQNCTSPRKSVYILQYFLYIRKHQYISNSSH